MKKLLATAAIAAALFAGTQSASAGYVTYTVNIPQTNLDWNNTTDIVNALVPKYDLGGIVSSVKLTLTGVVDVNYEAVNLSSVNPVNATVDLHIGYSLSNPLVSPDLVAAFDDNVTDVLTPNLAGGTLLNMFMNPSPGSFSVVNGTVLSATGHQTYTSPSEIANFIGSGTIDFSGLTESLVIGSLGANAQQIWTSTSGGVVTVTYGVPTPTPLALLGFGLVALAFVTRKRRLDSII